MSASPAALRLCFGERGLMKTIKRNVGRRPHRHCMNLSEDQFTVLTLLSRIPIVYGGPQKGLNFIVRPGYCADDLYEAILRFQKLTVLTLSQPDGIVSPNGATMQYLNRMADLYDPVTTPGKMTDDQVFEAYGDAMHDVTRERIDQNAPEYLRKIERQKEAAKKKWKDWKARIIKDGKGGLNAKLAVQYLDEQEKKSSHDSTIAFFPGIVGFGEAFVGYDYQGGWRKWIMLEEELLGAYDRRKLLINTYGMTRDMPIILLSNFTHYVMKKDEVKEFNNPN